MITGFIFAAYSVVGNDVIQTLGTFLSSNNRRPWWVLWLFSASILTFVMIYGWISYSGDVSYGRLTNPEKPVPFPDYFYWWYALPPLVLLVITRFGIPVSTTFLIISVFSPKHIPDMIIKSGLGYLVAFVLAIIIYYLVSKTVEKKFIDTNTGTPPNVKWVVLQWLSTGFLWGQWLIQDLANIFIYLPRPLSLEYLIFGLAVLLILQAIIFYFKGGSIQKIVTSKTNTNDIRSATIVDFIYGFILLFFKELSQIPMSTTWIFVGLLAGRELAIALRLKNRPLKMIRNMVFKDLAKVFLGLIVSVILVVLIRQLQ